MFQLGPLTNTPLRYGWVTMILHWSMAIGITGMFCLGWWMVDLDYYDAWYQRGPNLHRSLGVVMMLLWLARLGWRWASVQPVMAGDRLQTRLASTLHWAFYVLIPLLGMSGYLITTADGRGVAVFGWFTIPASLTGFDNQEDLAGEIHWYLALCIIGGACLHSLAALKHEFIDRDGTLSKMLGRKVPNTKNVNPTEDE